MNLKKKIVVGVLSAACLFSVPALVGCDEDKIKDLESQISTLESQNAQLVIDKNNLKNQNDLLIEQNDALAIDIREANYQMLCAVMTQLPICDVENESSIRNAYANNLSVFNDVWGEIVASKQKVDLGKQYKVQSNGNWYVVQFTYGNNTYSVEMFSAQTTENSGTITINREFLLIDAKYNNGDFSQINLKNGKWIEESNDTEGTTTTKISRIAFNKDNATNWTSDNTGMNDTEEGYKDKIIKAFGINFNDISIIAANGEE